jgi:Fe-S-cluster-containing dehydrogenase component
MKRGTPPAPEHIVRAARAAGLHEELSRRGFIILTAGTLAGAAVLGLGEALGASRRKAGPPLVILDNARGVLLADPTRCVGCQRCELACSEGNDGVAQPSLSRIKISRALNYGPEGPGQGPHGLWGDGLILQGVCRQCPHPVPCATACPQDAIVMDEKTGARVVDEAACVGCRLCQSACPWGMMVFDEARQKSSKCHLCHGRPRCVAACPSAALRFVPWRDLTREGPPPLPTFTALPAAKTAACIDCHAPTRRPGKRR